MADYHPLIARAVSGLEKNSGENRRALYERARVALVAQLRGVVPALEESEITRERLSLEEAIRKVEAEAARQAREAVRPAVPRRTELPRREEPPRPAPRAPITPSTLATPRPARSAEPPPESPPTSSSPPSPPRPTVGARRPLQDEALKGFRDSTTHSDAGAPEPRRPQPRDTQSRETQSRDTWSPPESNPPPAPELPPEPPAPPPPERHPLEDYGQLEPQLQAENLWALPLDGAQGEAPVDLDTHHPQVERHQARDEPDEHLMPRRPPRSYGTIIRIGLVLTLIVAVGSLVVWQRSNIVDLASSVMALFRPPSAPPREAAAPARPKITDRIGQPSPQPSGPPVAQRVVLYEEETDDPAGKRFVGTVLWRTEMRPASPGRPPELAVRGDVEVPERKMSVTLSFRRNTDASLPASHTVEIVFTLPPDSPSGGVQKVPGVLMKQAEQTRGVPLAGLAVPVTPGYFLIGLSALESDMQRNVQLLKERSWFDIPIIYNNNRRAILALEKGTPGEQAFNQAFAAWKQ
jgi:hypothetical protein